jgi:hypothetical protein
MRKIPNDPPPPWPPLLDDGLRKEVVAVFFEVLMFVLSAFGLVAAGKEFLPRGHNLGRDDQIHQANCSHLRGPAYPRWQVFLGTVKTFVGLACTRHQPERPRTLLALA